MDTKLASVNFRFPTFGLSVQHDGTNLVHANFFNPALDDLPEFSGEVMGLSYRIKNQLESYCADPLFEFDLPYQLNGTPHQLKIWHVMEQIKSGTTMTYGEVAKLIASAPRAVGGACGKNPLPVIVPCHRIIAGNNQLGGFNSGNIFFSLGIKQWLLQHEGIKLAIRK